MSGIIILDRFPVVLTKDRETMENFSHPIRAGQIIILPEDAVLVIAPVEDSK